MNIQYAPRSGIVDVLIMDIARRIQLPPSSYRVATDRYETMARHLQRPESPMSNAIVRLYGQGSVSIGAVISSKFDNDEFDVDAIVELAIPADAPPALVLDNLFVAINGKPESRYHGKTVRHSRCVTVEYDEMHIDFTPAVLHPSLAERTSTIFHANQNEVASAHYHKVANPWGFAEWFKLHTPRLDAFAKSFVQDAAEPLPEPAQLSEKSLPLQALQLLKRWRNKCFNTRKRMRMPPSVVLAYFTAALPGHRSSLFGELLAQARNLLQFFESIDRTGRLVRILNPACPLDVLTDRWPGSQTEQHLFISDLQMLVTELEALCDQPTIAECQLAFGRLFGERAAQDAVNDYAARHKESAHAGRVHHHLGTGAIALGQSGLAARSYGSTAVAPTARHTDFGSPVESEKP